MKQSRLRPVGLFLVSFAFTLFMPVALAQTNSNPLVGTWQTSLELGQGWPAATGVFQAQPDGRYREEMYVQNQLAAFWEGTYTLTPDGTFTQTETNKSPQLCLQGQCMPNDGPGVNVSQVNVAGPDTFTVTAQDSGSAQSFTLTWQRIGGEANPTANPTVDPAAQTPQFGGAPSSQFAQSPIVGSWQISERTSAGHTVVTVFTYTADGRFNVQNLLNGQSLMSSYGGAYSLLPDGTYYENTTEKSDMYCYLQCQPNPAQLGNAGPLGVSFPDANTLTFTDGRGSYSVTRAQSGGVPAGTPAVGGTVPNTMPNTGAETYPYNPGAGTDTGDFIGSTIWEASPQVDPNTGATVDLPLVADPGTTYYDPDGNVMTQNEISGTWTQTDPNGWETELEPGE